MKKINCILLVDDNPADNEFHTITLKKADVCSYIKVATDGEQALAYLLKSGEEGQSELFPKPDIIYLDINMPRMNGFEFLLEYKKLSEDLKSRVVIIMLTTSLNPDDHEKAKSFEVHEFENKPLTAEIVRQTIDKYF